MEYNLPPRESDQSKLARRTMTQNNSQPMGHKPSEELSRLDKVFFSGFPVILRLDEGLRVFFSFIAKARVVLVHI